MLSSSGQLAAAELAIYILLIIPTIYTFFIHGKHGLLGWFFIFSFCMLRIIGSALTISDEKKHSASETTQIIAGVGLSPLLLGVSGILMEVNHYLIERRTWVLRWPSEAIMHGIVGTALALVIVGIKNGGTIAKVGYVLFVVVCVMIVGLTTFSWRLKQRSGTSRKLLIGISLSLPFLGVRVLYSLISQFDKDINAYTGPIAYRVVLSVLMEFFVVIVLVAFGVLTRAIAFEQSGMAKVVSPVKGEVSSV